MTKQMCKFGTDELMELIDVFNVSAATQAKIRALLAEEPTEPDAGNFFRYYNDRSKTVEFEREFAQHMGCRHALAVNSGTSALIASLVGAGIGPGDEVIVPAYTFFASVSAIVVAKAVPVIVDIDDSLTISPEAIEKAIMMAEPNDLIMILGKGNEDWEEVKGEFLDFNDEEEARRAIKKKLG